MLRFRIRLTSSSVCAWAFLLFTCSAIALGANAPYSLAQDSDNANSIHQLENATTQFDIHPELDVELFAAEPLMANPSNIDVDSQGRVWVCEVMNYRQKIANGDIPERTEGDRIIVVEDTDGDGAADKTHVFYQGRDIDSAHGICVLGSSALVSANDSVFYLHDDDGDLKADRKELLFTGIEGVQHDHGIHAFVFGPDGKLYFNFGNAGGKICDAEGKIVIDRAGNEVKATVRPYQQGMVFRCNLDGSDFETLAWNFRNNWEVAVDSFGTMWQSDNDDDGNRATRINYVMPYGNYGFRDEFRGHGWRDERTGMNEEIPLKHWHLADPGVMPNLLQTGAGSPTGMCVYEGDMLPEVFHNQMIHCDAGPNIVRSYPVEKQGAGYSATIVNMVDGAQKNQWFRPSDVCVAPDGSLIIADWYDPGVGGHRMRDRERGRLFRVTKKGTESKYVCAEQLTQENAIDWLNSPNLARRYEAWSLIKSQKSAEFVDRLQQQWTGHPIARLRARAMWALGEVLDTDAEVTALIEQGLKDSDPDIQIATLRLSRKLQKEINLFSTPQQLLDFPRLDVQVHREILIGLREMQPDNLAQVWTQLAIQYPIGDRWYLEALGIAAEGHWDECMAGREMIREATNDSWTQPASFRDVVWRSRGSQSAKLLAEIISDDTTSVEELPRYFRAFDFLDPKTVTPVLEALAFSDSAIGAIDESAKSRLIFRESTNRLSLESLTDQQRAKVESILASCNDEDFVALATRFGNDRHDKKLLQLAISESDGPVGAGATAALVKREQLAKLNKALREADDETFASLLRSLVRSGEKKSGWVLAGYADMAESPLERRILAVRALGKTNSGAGDLLWRAEQGKVAPEIEAAVAATLHSVPWGYIKDKAKDIYPLPPSADDKPLPSISDLLNRKGDITKGAAVFVGVGTCAKCHLVNGQGIEVGPDLSEIGDKLSPEAMVESILFPSAGISHNYENWLVLKEDGEVISGVLLNKTQTETVLKNAEGVVYKIPASEIDQQKRLKLSIMPADLHRQFSEQDLVDLIAYLGSLKKQK